MSLFILWKKIFNDWVTEGRELNFFYLTSEGDNGIYIIGYVAPWSYFWPRMASDVLGGQIWGHPVPQNRGRLATFDFSHDLKKCFLLWFLTPQTAYISWQPRRPRRPASNAKFQSRSLETEAVNRLQTERQTAFCGLGYFEAFRSN